MENQNLLSGRNIIIAISVIIVIAVVGFVLYRQNHRPFLETIDECITTSEIERAQSSIGDTGTIRLVLFGRHDTEAQLFDRTDMSVAISPTFTRLNQFVDTGEDYILQAYIFLEKGMYRLRYSGNNDNGHMDLDLTPGQVVEVQIACP